MRVVPDEVKTSSILHGASSPHYYLLYYVLRSTSSAVFFLISIIIIYYIRLLNINLGPVSSAGPFWDSFLYHHHSVPLPAQSRSLIGCRLYYISIESQTIYGVPSRPAFVFFYYLISFFFYFLSVITAHFFLFLSFLLCWFGSFLFIPGNPFSAFIP